MSMTDPPDDEDPPDGMDEIHDEPQFTAVALAELLAADSSAAGSAKVLDALRRLRSHESQEWLRCRAVLKKYGILTEIERLLGTASSEETSNIATELVEMVVAEAELWHDARSRGYATLVIDEMTIHLPISERFKEVMSRRYYQTTGSVPSAASLGDAIKTLSAIARYDGPQHDAVRRVGVDADTVYLDLADDAGRCVRITPLGYEVVDAASIPIRFVRGAGMMALPVPESGGTIEELRSLVNVADEEWALVPSWCVGALVPAHPCYLLSVEGEAGSGKTTASKIFQALIDPSFAELRRPPTSDRDIAIACENSWLIGYENLSGLPAALSDTLCVVITGGGFATRKLFTDDEEQLFHFRRPVLANGIDTIARREDLADRTLTLHLKAIPEGERIAEDELWARFDAARPRLLGVLLEGVSTALRRRVDVRNQRHSLPRMADATIFAMAAAPAFGLRDADVLNAINANRAMQVADAVQDDPVALGLQRIADDGGFEGSPTELLRRLNVVVAEDERGQRWPESPSALRVKRRAPVLRAVGVLVEQNGSHSAGRKWIVRRTRPSRPEPSQESGGQARSSGPANRESSEGHDGTAGTEQREDGGEEDL